MYSYFKINVVQIDQLTVYIMHGYRKTSVEKRNYLICRRLSEPANFRTGICFQSDVVWCRADGQSD
jgi:hypothetical protein